MREYATQMEAAKKGIITPEMKIVAEKEYMDPEEQQKTRKALLDYCCLDTFAMVMVWQKLCGTV